MDELYSTKKECCGCMACFNICPKHAITMNEDENGFRYPHINKEKCVECGLCLKVCNYKKDLKGTSPKECYAACSTQDDVLKITASGGIFTVLASKVIEDKGIVYGAGMFLQDNQRSIKHTRISNESDLYILSGSKYAQSDINSVFNQIKNDIRNERQVLFAGTPCQVDGLLGFLGGVSEYLTTIDIICHGVPNTKIFFDYIDYLEHTSSRRIIDFKFRDKTKGWGLKGSYTYIDSDGKKKVVLSDSKDSSYYQFFLGSDIYRDNCYSCKYACGNRCSDITLGDYWGIEEMHPEYLLDNCGCIDAHKGVSCILVNSSKGMQLLNSINKEEMVLLPTTLDKVRKTNRQLNMPSEYGKYRKKVLSKYRKEGYSAVESFWKHIEMKKRVKDQIKKMIGR